MRIGVDIRVLMDARYSGVSEFACNLLERMLEADRMNSYCLYYNSRTDISARMPVFASPNVRIIWRRIPNKLLNYSLFLPFGRPRIDRVTQSDIFYMPHYNFIGLSPEAKLVLTIHDLSFLRSPGFFSPRKNIWHSLVNIRKLARRASRIAAVSENTRRDVIELCGIDEERTAVIYPGLGKEFELSPGPEELARVKARYSLPGKFILFLGTIEPRKNIAGLIRAFSIFRAEADSGDIKLVIAGGDGWSTKPTYQAWQESEFREDIFFKGYVEKDDKPALYRLANLFVYPSFFEGFGFPPLEAMACGTPVIASAVSSLPESAGAAALLVNPYDDEEIAFAIKNMLADNSLRERYIAKGREHAGNFSWDKAADGYLSLFKSVFDSG